MRPCFLLPFLLFFPFFHPAEARTFSDPRSESIDILRYQVNLSIRNLSSKTISGSTDIYMKARKNGITAVSLDLLNLNITRISVAGTDQVFTRNDSVVFVTLGTTRNTGDTFTLKVEYNGQPQQDPKWGGFYFSGNYAYNLGVGFEVNPHNFGRCWFPCFDNFEERSTYEFFITTDSAYTAVCNGTLVSSSVNPDKSVTWHWLMTDEIPTYLAQVAVSTYSFVNSQHISIQRTIPVMLAAQAADTNNLKSSFVHLPDAISCFENRFGPYQFMKVGYTLVPFNSGAMEHATNIAYPIYAANGSTANETLFAHELSHHWWGDLVTCLDAGDMWINEGWASYSENLFLEQLYGKAAYTDAVKANHRRVVRYAHLLDGDFRAVSGIPHQYTYGEHVYKKGSDMVHTLRAFMGDSAFFSACRSFLTAYAFKNATTDQLRAHFQTFTSANLNSFFNDWINHRGFADFKIRRTQVLPDGSQFRVKVTIQQELRAAEGYYSDVPLEISFYDQAWRPTVKTAMMSGGMMDVEFVLPFSPVFTVLDEAEKISDAVTTNQQVIKTTLNTTYPDGLLGINTQVLPDSVLFRVEHHWTAPDRHYKTPAGIYLSNYRYWTVGGIWPSGFRTYGYFNYDGTTPGSMNSGFLDHTLIKGPEDSLFLLWRPNADSDWELIPDSIVVRQTGVAGDKTGRFWVKNLKQGEYALAAMNQQLAGIPEKKIIHKLTLRPNPAGELLELLPDFSHQDATVTITDMAGKTVRTASCLAIQDRISIDISGLAAGIYSVTFDDGKIRAGEKLVIR